MAKTRSQTGNIAIKKENEDHKDIQLLHSVNNTVGNASKIAKRKASKSKSNLVSAQEVKVEESTDVKLLLKISPALEKLEETRYISQEKIRQLIRYVVSDKIAISKAASKLKIRVETASYYYTVYNNDPENKIPVPLWQLRGNKNVCTQKQITKLIKHIVDDDMTILAASAKTNMSCNTGRSYYKKYLEDPKHNIPMQGLQKSKQEQIRRMVGYIVDGKMSLKVASKKANIGFGTGKKYYQKYLDDPNHDIPVGDPQSRCGPCYTQDQINGLISFIVNDKMTITAASRKADMSGSTGWKYYRKYRNDPNHCIPVSGFKIRVPYTTIPQDKIKQFIGYITEDKMSIRAASRKAEMSCTSGRKYYHQYINDPSFISTTPNNTQEQINELIGFIVDDKMTVNDASEKASISLATGEKCYQQYLNDLYRDIPTPSHIARYRRCTEEQISTLIRYVIDDKMALKAASKKASMSYDTGIKYFKEYVNDPNNNITMPDHVFHARVHGPEQINALISYVVNDGMSVANASKKANMGVSTARKYYHRYINGPNNDITTHLNHHPPCTQEQIANVIRNIVEDKMTIAAASKKANMSQSSGRKYYILHLQDQH